MTNLFEWFVNLTGLSVVNWQYNPLFIIILSVFGFLIIYEIIHVLFSSFTNLF